MKKMTSAKSMEVKHDESYHKKKAPAKPMSKILALPKAKKK